MSDYPIHALSRITRLSDESLLDRLFSIGAPRSLIGLHYAVHTIIQILDLPAINDDLRGIAGEADWRTLHEDLRVAEGLPPTLAHVPDRDKGYPRWMHSQVTQHPLYTALVTPSIRALAIAQRSATPCGALLIYGGKLFRSFGRRDSFAASLTHDADVQWINSEYRSSVAAASLALRSATSTMAAECWLPDLTLSTHAFQFQTRLADERYVRRNGSIEPTAADNLSHHLAHMIQIACAIKVPRSVDRPSNNWTEENEREPSSDGGLTTDRHNADEHGVLSTYVMEVAPATKADSDVPAPERPISYRTTISVIDLTKDRDEDLAQADAQGYRRALLADSAKKQVAKSQMDLATAPALPTARERSTLGKLVAAASSELRADAARLACIIHATGRSDAQCMQAIFSRSTIEPVADVEYLLDLRCWRLSMPAPAHEDTGLWDLSSCREWQGFANFPDLTGAAERIDIANANCQEGARIVREGAKSLRMLRAGLRDLSSGPRKLRPGWIRAATRRRLHAACSDDLPAALIYGGRRKNTETAIHYSTPAARFVESVYRQAFGSRDEDIEWLNPPGVHVGSKLCPTDQFVREWIKQAKAILRRTRKKDIVTCHRIYVRYVALMVMHACALRATKDPRPDVIDVLLRCAIVDDKSRRPGQSTRMLVLPTIVLELLDYYESHRLAVLREFGALDKSPSEYPYFFDLLDGEITKLAPKHFRESIEGLCFPVPPNSMRRHMRTRLMELGEDAQSIDPAMSHWRRSTSPQSNTSTFPWLAAMQAIEKTVTKLITGLGWTALPGYVGAA